MDHGEVFTPDWLVNDMLNLVAHEAERIDSRFLEPACGEGAFLAPILLRKLATVRRQYGSSPADYEFRAVLALMSIYGWNCWRITSAPAGNVCRPCGWRNMNGV